MKKQTIMSSSSMMRLLPSICGLLLLVAVIVPCMATTVADQDKASPKDFTQASLVGRQVATIVDAATGTRMLQNIVTNATETDSPTDSPTANATATTNATTANATTDSPTESPAPSPSPSDMPTSIPTITPPPTVPPTSSPTESPAPSPAPSDTPTLQPSKFPSISPTLEPSVSSLPSISPSISLQPSISPSNVPSHQPSISPSVSPSMRPSLVTETRDSFSVQLILELEIDNLDNATTTTSLNSTIVEAFEQATADWLDTVVMKDGSLSNITVTVTAQELKPVAAASASGGAGTDAAAANSSAGNDSGGGGKRNLRHDRNLQQHQPQQVYLEIEMNVDATYSGPDANFDLHKALDPLIQAHDDDWMRNLADAAPTVFESLRPASMAAIFEGDQGMTTTASSSSGMSTGGYAAVIIVSIMALALGIAASVFVIKAHQQYVGDLLSAKSLPSPSPSYNMSMDEEYPLKPRIMMPVPPVSEQSENSPLREGQVAPSPSSCSTGALEFLGCGTNEDDYDEQEQDREMENTPPTSPNTMEKGRDKHTKVNVAAGNNNRAATAAGGTNLFDGIPFHKPAPPDDGSYRQDPPSFSEVDFGTDNRSLFDPVGAAAKTSSLLLLANNSHSSRHQHVAVPLPPSTMLHAHPRDPSDRGIGSSMLHRHPDPITSSSSRFDPMNMDKMSEASSSWYDNNRPSGHNGRVSDSIAARIAQFEKNSDPGSGHDEGGRELKLTKSSGGTLGATAVDRSAAGTGSDLSSHARDFFSSILGGPNNAAKPALGSDAQNSAGSNANSNTSSLSRKGPPPVNPSSHHQRKPSYESLLRRGGAGLYDVFAPAGPIGIVVDTTSNGPAVHSLRNTSPMVGLISPGDLIVGLDDEDTRSMTAATLTRRMAQKANQKERKITLLTMDGSY